jgi:hypothetical protein
VMAGNTQSAKTAMQKARNVALDTGPQWSARGHVACGGMCLASFAAQCKKMLGEGN